MTRYIIMAEEFTHRQDKIALVLAYMGCLYGSYYQAHWLGWL